MKVRIILCQDQAVDQEAEDLEEAAEVASVAVQDPADSEEVTDPEASIGPHIITIIIITGPSSVSDSPSLDTDTEAVALAA